MQQDLNLHNRGSIGVPRITGFVPDREALGGYGYDHSYKGGSVIYQTAAETRELDQKRLCREDDERWGVCGCDKRAEPTSCVRFFCGACVVLNHEGCTALVALAWLLGLLFGGWVLVGFYAVVCWSPKLYGRHYHRDELEVGIPVMVEPGTQAFLFSPDDDVHDDVSESEGGAVDGSTTATTDTSATRKRTNSNKQKQQTFAGDDAATVEENYAIELLEDPHEDPFGSHFVVRQDVLPARSVFGQVVALMSGEHVGHRFGGNRYAVEKVKADRSSRCSGLRGGDQKERDETSSSALGRPAAPESKPAAEDPTRTSDVERSPLYVMETSSRGFFCNWFCGSRRALPFEVFSGGPFRGREQQEKDGGQSDQPVFMLEKTWSLPFSACFVCGPCSAWGRPRMTVTRPAGGTEQQRTLVGLPQLARAKKQTQPTADAATTTATATQGRESKTDSTRPLLYSNKIVGYVQDHAAFCGTREEVYDDNENHLFTVEGRRGFCHTWSWCPSSGGGAKFQILDRRHQPPHATDGELRPLLQREGAGADCEDGVRASDSEVVQPPIGMMIAKNSNVESSHSAGARVSSDELAPRLEVELDGRAIAETGARALSVAEKALLMSTALMLNAQYFQTTSGAGPAEELHEVEDTTEPDVGRGCESGGAAALPVRLTRKRVRD